MSPTARYTEGRITFSISYTYNPVILSNQSYTKPILIIEDMPLFFFMQSFVTLMNSLLFFY